LLGSVLVIEAGDEKCSFCSKLLADLGAKVIKVEPPYGEASRRIGPFYQNTPHPEKSLYFWYHNVNKLGVTLDLESKRDQQYFLILASKADVIVESFPPGYLQKFGLGYDRLSSINPGIILASITGFGQTGPYRDYKSCDLVASAVGGQMYLCGASDTPPVKPYGDQSYYVACLFAAVGILIALYHRRLNGGRGQHVDVSLQEAVAATVGQVLVDYFHRRIVARRGEAFHPQDSLYLLPCKDGYILAIDREWDTLVGWLDSEGMAADLKQERWQSEGYRRQHWKHIMDVLTRWTQSHTRSELFDLAQAMRLPWAPIYSLEEMIASTPHLERNFLIPVEHPEVQAQFLYPASPLRFLSTAEGTKTSRRLRRPPLIGEHNSLVFGGELCGAAAFGPCGSFEVAEEIETKFEPEVRSCSKRALEGVRVLDFTWLLAGPYATRILADFGAEVIKVQSRKTATGAESNDTPYFSSWNRNKLGITLDMNHPQGREIALKLVEVSDIVIENFTPRVKWNWGLDYQSLKAVKPDVILVSLSATGQNGSWKNFASFAPTLHALSGITYLTSFPHKPNLDTHHIPLGLGFPYADIVAALFAVLAVLAALEHRRETGEGQHVDISEYECICSLLGPAILDYNLNRNRIAPQGNDSGYLPRAPYGCYRCAGEDKWCVIAVSSEEEWQSLCHVMGKPPWTEDKKFSTLAERQANRQELNRLLEQWTIAHTPHEVMNLLQQAGVPAAIVADAHDLANDPHLKARNFFIQIEHPLLGKTVCDGTPVKLSLTPATFRRPAPLLGQHNDYVYRQLLGMSREELSRYIAESVIS